MKTQIKHLEEAIVYLGRILKAGNITGNDLYHLDKALSATYKALDALLIEELEK
jgi:hypothetical protein